MTHTAPTPARASAGPSPPPAVRIRGLVVCHGAHRAVDGIDLEVPRGSVFGLLGPNGAGKSTTLMALAGLMPIHAGTVEVDGLDVARAPAQVRRRLGLAPQSLALYESLSVLQNLHVFAGLFGTGRHERGSRIRWALDLACLDGRERQRVSSLSIGMKRRLNLVCALLHDPPVIVCDEPTTGVDPQSRHHLFDTLRALAASGRTLLYTTHYMEEVEALCDRVAIMDHGRVVACDPLAHLLARGGTERQFRVTLGGDGLAESVHDALLRAGLPPREVVAVPRSLEQLFLELTGRRLREDT